MIWQLCAELREPFVVVTLVSGRGHIPQNLGAKAVVTASGLKYGTIGGGKVEAKAIGYAVEKISSKRKEPELLTWNLTQDIGMTCGGEMTFLFESHGEPNWSIAIFGAGHVAQALVPLLATLDCQIQCADPRREWLERIPSSPRVRLRLLPEPKEIVKDFGANTFFVCVSQGHAHDIPVLLEISKFHPETPFIGVIGSETKASSLRRDLRAAGASDAFIERIRCPIGLALGTNNPAEIAVSITAQLLQVRDQLQ